MTSRHRLRTLTFLLVLSALLAGCTNTHQSASTTSGGDGWESEFQVATSDWSSHGSNSFFVLEPGYTLVFESQGGKQKERLVITVLDETQTIDGVETRVIEERETADGNLKEVSRNFFAVSKRTNDVFYFGEEVDIYENGKIVEHEGAWRSGVGGAKFGLMMPGTVRMGAKFYQEHAPGVALDRFEVVSLEKTLETPAGRFEHCLHVEETTPLEPDNKDSKIYAPGIGLAKDGNLLLVSYGKAPAQR